MADPRVDPERPEAAAPIVTHLRVRFAETDLMGIVHHSNYLVYCEAGRVDWLRRRGLTYTDLVISGIQLPVIEANVRYRSPARFDDELRIETTLSGFDIVSVSFSYRLLCGDERIADASTRQACVDERNKLQRLPKPFLSVLRPGRAERD